MSMRWFKPLRLSTLHLVHYGGMNNETRSNLNIKMTKKRSPLQGIHETAPLGG
jgi:hypothetical protein